MKKEYFNSIEIGGTVQELMTVLKVGEMPQVKFKIPIIFVIKAMDEDQRALVLEALSDPKVLEEMDSIWNQL